MKKNRRIEWVLLPCVAAGRRHGALVNRLRHRRRGALPAIFVLLLSDRAGVEPDEKDPTIKLGVQTI